MALYSNIDINKNLCGRDGRTICGPRSVRAENRKDVTDDNWTDGQTDGQTDRQMDRQSATHNAPPPREEGRIITTGTRFINLALSHAITISGKYNKKAVKKLFKTGNV